MKSCHVLAVCVLVCLFQGSQLAEKPQEVDVPGVHCERQVCFFYLVTAGALAMTLMSIYLKTSVNEDFYCQPPVGPVCIYFMSVQAV